jgi:hypothetical protein
MKLELIPATVVTLAQGFQYFSSLPVLHYLQAVILLKILTIFMNTIFMNILYNTL